MSDEPNTPVDFLGILDQFAQLVEALSGMRALLVADGWTAEQAQEIITANFRNTARDDQ